MDCQELFTENLKLRKAKKDDLQLIWKNVWQDEEIAKNMLWEVTKTEEKAHIRLEKTITYQQENYAYFVCLKSNDEPIGFAGVFEKENGIFEESGISKSDIELDHFMNLNYFKYGNNLQVYYGVLKNEVNLVEEKNKLEWVEINRGLLDNKKFAGNYNIPHIIKQILVYMKNGGY